MVDLSGVEPLRSARFIVLLFSFCHFFDDGLAIAACVPPKREKGIEARPTATHSHLKKTGLSGWLVGFSLPRGVGGRCFKGSLFQNQPFYIPGYNITESGTE